ncbi:hypothetical protein [Agrococcus lahaulensis]|uniref:hypothetical protein n=1 Tax=Agrococcus lahaulensis TaxID=341722 RepID=UPI00047B2212|nr:hypothetical protein [Agrococcus lahaulensis]
MARRPLAAALVLAAGALVLTGCIPEPPAIPSSPAQPADPQPADPQPVDPQPVDPDASAPAGDANTALGETVTVDDNAGDSWSFAVTGIEENPPLEAGSPESGTRFIALLVDGERVEGGVDFSSLFWISVIGSDGEQYAWEDTLHATAENDIFFAVDDAFTGARALIQLPEGVDPQLVVLRSAYGYPAVDDVVVDVR